MSLADLVDGMGLVDHHCHSVTSADLDRAGIEGFLTEAHTPAAGLSPFDAPAGLGVRRWCAPLLDLDRSDDPDTYAARRRQLGADEVNRRFLRAARVTDLLVDTGYRQEEMVDPGALARISGAGVHEVLRLETLAEGVASRCPPPGFAQEFEDELGRRAGPAVALKSIVAYRHGLDLSREEPSPVLVAEAAARWRSDAETTGSWRLTDPVVLRFVLAAAARLGHRLQLHTGLGDPDVRLHRADPSLLPDFLEAVEPTGTTVLLLHCWPYHRHAAQLAAVYPHVYFDVGLALNHAGPNAGAVLAEAMEVAPYHKMLYSSDGFGLAEMHYLGAVRFRRALTRVLQRWVDDDEIGVDEAASVARAVGAGNARRVYGLPSRPE